MVTIRTFKGLRPKPELASEIAALPYDVYSSEEAKAIIKKQPLSFLRVTKSEATLPDNIDVHSALVYEEAGRNLQKYIKEDLLKMDAKPSLYVYEQEMDGRQQIGLVACVSVDEYKANIIKKHEFTRPDKEKDRVDHITATRAQTGFVFLAYKDQTNITDCLKRIVATEQPEYSFIAEDNIKHALYLISDNDRIGYLTKAFAELPNLYIADGHHRSAAALRVAEAGIHSSKDNEDKYFMAAIFPDSMLRIMDYNRIIRDLNGLTEEAFLEKVKSKFSLELAMDAMVKPQKFHEIRMYMGNKWYILTPNTAFYDDHDVIERLDVSILQNNLLAPILGIQDPRTDKRIDFIGGIRGLRELVEKVDSGQYKVAFALFPTSMKQLMDVADADLVMPPKSTWFEPKLRDAMVVHLIGDEK